jgi:membrane protein
VGFVALIVTSILLLDNIDWNFNEIWHVDRRRRLVSRLTAYTSVLVFGTILIGLRVVIWARLKTLLVINAGIEVDRPGPIGALLLPLASSFLIYLLMFLIIPATRVHFRSAAVGAAFSAVTWEVGKYVFALSVGASVKYSTIYGSIAAIPIFLIWLYYTWVLVLVGLEVAFTHQHFEALTRKGEVVEPRGRDRVALGVKLFAAVAHRFDTGDRPPTTDQLADRFGVGESAVQEMVALLRDKNLLRTTVDGDEEGLVPALSLDRVGAVDVVRAAFGGTSSSPSEVDALEAEVDEIVGAFERAGNEAIAGLDFRDLLRRHQGGNSTT